MAIKRSIYLINPKFQLKFSVFVSTLVFIPSLLYPYTIYRLIELLAQKVNSPEIQEALSANQGKLLFLLFLWQLAFTAIVFIICIFQSHKIAGPMFKLKTYLDNVKKGNAPGHLFFRKGDNFQDIADDFNEAIGAIRNQHAEDFTKVNNAITFLDKIQSSVPSNMTSSLNETKSTLQEIVEKFRTS